MRLADFLLAPRASRDRFVVAAWLATRIGWLMPAAHTPHTDNLGSTRLVTRQRGDELLRICSGETTKVCQRGTAPLGAAASC